MLSPFAPHILRPWAAPSLKVNTKVNTHVAAMTDVELDDYRQLLPKLKALLPEEAPKVIEGIVAR